MTAGSGPIPKGDKANGDIITIREHWRPIPGFEDAYEISDLGRVRGIERVVPRSDGHKRRVAERLMSTRFNGTSGVGLWRSGKRTWHSVPALQAAAFETSRRREVVP